MRSKICKQGGKWYSKGNSLARNDTIVYPCVTKYIEKTKKNQGQGKPRVIYFWTGDILDF